MNSRDFIRNAQQGSSRKYLAARRRAVAVAADPGVREVVGVREEDLLKLTKEHQQLESYSRSIRNGSRSCTRNNSSC